MTHRKLFNMICDDMNKPGNLFLSNMTGPLKAPWVFKGKKVDWVSLCAMTPTLGPSVSIMTHHECVKVTVTADKGEFPETKQLLDRIVHELEQVSEATSTEAETQESQ